MSKNNPYRNYFTKKYETKDSRRKNAEDMLVFDFLRAKKKEKDKKAVGTEGSAKLGKAFLFYGKRTM